MSAVAKVETGKPDYSYWANALAGTFGPVHEDDPQPGFYRKRTGKAAGYSPAAIWIDAGGTMLAVVDGQEVRASDIWTYVCQHPISEAHYRERMDTGKWWDESAAVTASLAHDTSTNNPPTDEAEILEGQIDAATAGAAEFTEIKDDETASKAQSLRSRLLELSGSADRLREDKKRPHLEAGKAIDAKLMPLVKLAKTSADTIRTALGAHETRKSREVERLRKIEDDARVEALRLEALKASPVTGENAVLAPEPPPPVPVPESATTIRGAYGRAASVKVVKVAKVVDQDKAYMAMRTHKELVELIAKLAQRAASAGVAVAGVEVTEERTVA